MPEIDIEYVQNLYPIFTKPKRIKIIVGGRASTKSVGIADYVAAKVSSGELWCCARENQNSIEESVHRTLVEEIERLGIPGFTETKTAITHTSGGRTFYRGLSRNITSLKSTLSGIDGLWIEEGEDISANTLRVLTASVRLNTADTIALLNGREIDNIEELEEILKDSDIKMPEIIITMNRGARTGAIAQKLLKRAEFELSRCGYYEDDFVMVVQMNYTDMPRSWFIASGLEQERLDDLETLSEAAYEHKWNGAYMDEVKNSIIKSTWFDAAVDAHKIERLEDVFKPKGLKLASYDPMDGGKDAHGYSCRHGSIIKRAICKTDGEIDVGCSWAMTLAREDGADWFIWDGDGMGTGLKFQVSQEFDGSKIDYHMFKGSLSGVGQDRANSPFVGSEIKKAKKKETFAETFRNNRSQYYYFLALRFYNTYRCVVKGEYVDPDQMISIDSDGVDDMDLLRSEICRIPRKENNTGLYQIMSKLEMAQNDIPSPNIADCIMMGLWGPRIKRTKTTQTTKRRRV